MADIRWLLHAWLRARFHFDVLRMYLARSLGRTPGEMDVSTGPFWGRRLWRLIMFSLRSPRPPLLETMKFFSQFWSVSSFCETANDTACAEYESAFLMKKNPKKNSRQVKEESMETTRSYCD